MKALLILSLFAGASAFAQTQTNGPQTERLPSDGATYERQTFEKIGPREQVQYRQEDTHFQLNQAKQNVKIDEQNIQQEEARLKDDEAQVDVTKASIKKYKAQKKEDEAILDKLEDKAKARKD